MSNPLYDDVSRQLADKIVPGSDEFNLKELFAPKKKDVVSAFLYPQSDTFKFYEGPSRASTPSFNMNDIKNVISSLESGNKGYAARNPKSSATGKYQFVADTAKEYANKLGIPFNEWTDPENQEKLFEAFTTDNIKGLKRNGLPVDVFHIYGAHQQGLTGFTNIMNNNITPSLKKNMRNNLPSTLRYVEDSALRSTWINYWKTKAKL